MIRLFALMLAGLLMVFSAQAQNDSSAKDKKSIEQAIENWNVAWKTKNAKMAAQDYSDDADWTNAYGMKQKGRAEIEKILTEVFSLAFVMEGNSETIEQTIRFLKADLATVITRVERKGQKLPSGEVLPTRKTSHLRVFLKTNKKWQIVSHLISDARDMERKNH